MHLAPFVCLDDEYRSPVPHTPIVPHPGRKRIAAARLIGGVSRHSSPKKRTQVVLGHGKKHFSGGHQSSHAHLSSPKRQSVKCCPFKVKTTVRWHLSAMPARDGLCIPCRFIIQNSSMRCVNSNATKIETFYLFSVSPHILCPRSHIVMCILGQNNSRFNLILCFETPVLSHFIFHKECISKRRASKAVLGLAGARFSICRQNSARMMGRSGVLCLSRMRETTQHDWNSIATHMLHHYGWDSVPCIRSGMTSGEAIRLQLCSWWHKLTERTYSTSVQGWQFHLCKISFRWRQRREGTARWDVARKRYLSNYPRAVYFAASIFRPAVIKYTARKPFSCREYSIQWLISQRAAAVEGVVAWLPHP